MSKLVQGVGVNDAGYAIAKVEYLDERFPSGRKKQREVWRCPYYAKWKSMLDRCYSDKHHKIAPTYKDCIVCNEWLTFSNFRKWMMNQKWKIFNLDKDLLLEGNKVYSPSTCIFLHEKVNSFISTCDGGRGYYMLGSHWHKSYQKFTSSVRNPFTKKALHLGNFDSELEAHFAWKYQKHLYSCQLANSEYVTDERVRQVLLHRYENFTIVEDNLK